MSNGSWFRLLAAALLMSIPALGQSQQPVINSLNPPARVAGQGFNLQLFGDNFCPDSIVRFNSTNLVPFNVITGQMTVSVNGGITAGLSGPVPVRVDSTNTTPSCQSNGFVSAPFAFQIVPLLFLDTAPLRVGAAGVNYQTIVVAAGGIPPYAFAVNALPPGLNLNAQTGQISGFPTQTGTFASLITVNDTSNQTADHTYTIVITSAPGISTSTLPNGTLNSPYTPTNLAAIGGTTPYGWSMLIGPPGLVLSNAGVLSGTPTQAGTFNNVQIRVADANGIMAERTFFVVIATAAAQITTSSLPNGTVGVAYPATNLIATGAAPFTWALVAGGPPGLSLSNAGLLSGTPTQAGTFNNVQIRVTDANGIMGERSFPVVIAPAAAPQIATTSLPNGTVGVTYPSTSLIATGTAPFAWTLVGGGPPGLSLSNAGVLSGTPTQAGTFNNVQIRATDALGVPANRTFSITIANAALQITTTSVPDATRGVAYSTSLIATGGGTPLTWRTTSPLPSGIALSTAGVLSGTTQQVGSFPITVSVSDPSTTVTRGLTLVVTDPVQTCIPFPAGFVPFATVAYVSAANANGDRLVVGSLQQNGLAEINRIPLPNLPNEKFCNPTVMLGPAAANVYQNVYVPTPAERAGDFSAFGGQLLDPASNQPFPGNIIPVSRLGSVYAWRIGPQPPSTPVTITTTTLPQATSFLAYQTPIGASGGLPPYTWSAPGGTPAGLTLNPATGVLSGAPTMEGAFSFSIQVRDAANQTDTKILQLIVGSSLVITTGALRNGQVGVSYEDFFSAIGGVGPYTWTSIGAPPPGLFVNAIGTIAGTPTFAGTFNLSVRVFDSRGQSAARSYSMTISPLFRITNETLAPATLGTFHEQTFSSLGGTAPIFWQLTGSVLPGLVLSNFNGVLSGLPTQSGSFFFTILATDSTGQVTSKPFTLTVNQGLRIAPDNLPNGATGTAYTQSFTVAGGTPPYTHQIGGFVPGLALNPGTGVFQGTPTQAGTYNFTIRVNDATGVLGTRSYTLIVVSNLQIATTSLPDATERTAYSQILAASGGTPPYSWGFTAGSLPEGLTLNSSTGSIGGTPARSGSASITVEVSDSAGQRIARQLTVNVLPAVTVQTAGTLANGIAGVPYSATLNASGGTSPYSWRVREGALPGGTQLSSSGQIGGIPTQAGRFTATVEATDATGRSAAAEIFITVTPPLLRFTSSDQLPAASAGIDYQFTPTVTGGTPPYRWALNGAPEELSIDADTGRISGRLLSTASLEFSIRVTDSRQIIASQSVTLRAGLPANPTANITGLPASGAPAQQVSPRLSITQPYPLPINGELNLTFEPGAVVDDPAIQFASGGRRIVFNIPAGQTDAAFNAVNAGIQTGTVAGAIRVTARLTALGTDITPVPAPTSTIAIARQSPTITSVRVNRTSGGFELVITAYATSREITSAAVRLQTTGTVQGTDFTVNLATINGPWYQSTNSNQFGSLCTITIPFTIQQGTSGSVTSATVTLTNAIGASQPASANF